MPPHADSLLAILAPKAPPQYLQDLQELADDAGELNDPARFRLPANASPAKQRLVAFLRERLRLPDVALVVLFGVRPWVWAALVMWLICAPIAHRLEVLPFGFLKRIDAAFFMPMTWRSVLLLCDVHGISTAAAAAQ